MESFRCGGVLKVERAKKGNKNFFHLRKAASLFRVMELFVVLVLISRISSQLPEAVKNSGEYFTGFKLTVLSPQFIFVLGNVIVITLFAKSGHFSGKDSARKNDFYNEFIEKSERVRVNHTARPLVEPDYQDKEVIFEKAVPSKDVHISHGSGAIKTSYTRSQSEKCNHELVEKPSRELRRSATEKCVKRLRCGEKLAIQGPFPEDSMSNDEFRQTIEAFIARQQRFLRDED